MKKKNQSVLIGVGITALVFIIIIIFILNYNKGNSNQVGNLPITSNTVDTSIIPTSKVENKTSISSSQSKCDTVAKNYFDTYKPTTSSGFETVNLSYENHYNQSNGSCYVLVSYNFNLKDNSDGSSSLKINYILIDVSRKDPNGNYTTVGDYTQSISAVDKINNRLDSCNVGGSECGSLSGFMTRVNPYLGK